MIFQLPIFIFWGRDLGNPIIRFIWKFGSWTRWFGSVPWCPRRLAQQLVHPPKTLRFSDPTGGALYFDPRGLKIFVVFKSKINQFNHLKPTSFSTFMLICWQECWLDVFFVHTCDSYLRQKKESFESCHELWLDIVVLHYYYHLL